MTSRTHFIQYKKGIGELCSLHALFFPPMARTTQSARKSTGGRGIRSPIGSRKVTRRNTDNKNLPVVPRRAPEPICKKMDADVSKLIATLFFAEVSTQWCYSCIDGGDLMLCDVCDRAMCTTRCMEIPVPIAQCEKLCFICPSCHNTHYRKNLQPYFVILFDLFVNFTFWL